MVAYLVAVSALKGEFSCKEKESGWAKVDTELFFLCSQLHFSGCDLHKAFDNANQTQIGGEG